MRRLLTLIVGVVIAASAVTTVPHESLAASGPKPKPTSPSRNATPTATAVPPTATVTAVVPTATPVPPTATSGPTGPATLTLAPAVAQDDARSPDGGGYTATEPSLLVGAGNGAAPNVAGYRFTDVALPPDALIESATFSLVKDGTEWTRLVVELGFEDSGDAAPFSASAPPASRSRTATQARLDQSVQLLGGTRYPLGDPAVLAQALQAVVARPDWQAGNSLVVLAYGPPSPAWARQKFFARDAGVETASHLVVAYRTADTSAISTATATATATAMVTATATRTAMPPTATPAATATPVVVPAQSNAEWTQDGHDAQRSGYTTEEPVGPWRLAWTWNGPDASGGTGGHFYDAPPEARTVTGGAHVYVPAGAQGLYALAKSDGRVTWHLATPAFNAAPAYDPATGSLFAGGADGQLYKVDAATGQVLGTYLAGSPLDKAVSLAGQAVFVTAADGRLHRVSTNSLAPEWVYDAGASASSPPAYSAGRGLVVFTAADLTVHAVDAGTGALRWRVKPTPNSPSETINFSRGWPVIAEKHGVVFVRILLPPEYLFDYPGTGGIYPNTHAEVRAFLQASPAHQSLFALRLDDGSSAFVPAVGNAYVEGWRNGSWTSEMPAQPVVKVFADGTEVVYIPFRNGQSAPPDGRWDSHMGEMVLDDTTIPGLVAGDLRFVKMARLNGQGGNSYVHIGDESVPITAAGDSILSAHWGASEGVRITDRSPSRGLTYSAPILTTNHPAIVRQQATCANFDPVTHSTTCGLTMYQDGRYWDGPGFWVYWNVVAPPGSPKADAYSAGFLPRYTYVSDGLVVVEGSGGELFVLRHSGQVAYPTATPAPASPTATPRTPTPTATPVATATPTLPATATVTAAPGGALALTGVTPSAAQVAQYEKLELTFDILNSAATTPDIPYDPAPPPGLAGRTGITVEAHFLPPGVSDWAQAVRQPAFRFQNYERRVVNGKEWMYPQGDPTWKVRFAPTQMGTWQYRVRAQDASVCAAGANPCQAWVWGDAGTFTVTTASPGNHGFIGVSPTDSRYFQLSDGTPFLGQGLNESFATTVDADTKLPGYGANGVSLLRAWMSSAPIAGSAWSPWARFGAPNYGGYLPDAGLKIAPVGSGHGFVFSLTPGAGQSCLFNGWTQGQVPIKPGTTYQLDVTARVTGVTGPVDASRPYGLTAKLGPWPSNNDCPGGLASSPALLPHQQSTDWMTLTATVTTGSTQQYLDFLYLILDNVSAGEAQISQISLRESLPGGGLGPELLVKSQSDAHLEYNALRGWTWDYVIDEAARNGVYLKLVVLEKNDRVWNAIRPDGTLTTSEDNNYFYAAPGTKVRRLHEYYWRYLAARWGYARSIHSWELVNEGDPFNGNHHEQANSFARYMHENEPNRHMVTTSFWHSFPVAQVWGNPQFPDLDYADLHAYVSTGLGAYEWNPPSGTTLETNTAYTDQGTRGALRVPAGTVSAPKTLPIRGRGTWRVGVRIRAEGLTGTCPYGDPAGLAGPQILLTLDGKGTGVVPANSRDPANYWTCTAPAGTYGYQTFSGSVELADDAWHELSLQFQTKYATTGTAWFDTLEVQAPDGRMARFFGDGTFDDRDRMDHDSTLYTVVYGRLDGARSVSGADKPIIRGEAGIDYAGGPQEELPQIAQDRDGVWLHNYLWGTLDAGGMYELYWWTDAIRQNQLLPHFRVLRDFLGDIPLTNGAYQDARAQTSDSGIRAIGQVDSMRSTAYLWVQNKAHTWWNVVNGGSWGGLTGTVTVNGFTPGARHSLDWWTFDSAGALTRLEASAVADNSGNLTLDLASLPRGATDAAVKIRPS